MVLLEPRSLLVLQDDMYTRYIPDERVCHNYSLCVCLVPRPIFGGPGNEVCVCVCV